MSFEREIRVQIPAGASDEEEDRLVEAAVDDEVDKIVDDMLDGLGF